MRKVYFVMLVVCLSGAINRLQAQTCNNADAGPDKTICSGGSVTIGTASQSGYLYAWTPSTGLSNANIAQPLASPTTTTSYLLTQTGSNMLTNPGFESGNTGFNSDLSNVSTYPQPSEYAVSDDEDYSPCLTLPHSGFGTLMFVATAPNSNPSNYRAWYQTLTVSQNMIYNFSGFFRNGSWVYDTDVQARIVGNSTGASTTNYTLSNYCEDWDDFNISWNSTTNTSVTLEFRITSAGANHQLFLDDLRFSCVTTDWVDVNITSGASVTPAGPITYYNHYENTSSFMLTATAASSYQWYKDNVAISGATSQTYSIPFSGLGSYSDDYKCVTSCGTTNTVTFNYIGCTTNNGYPVSVPTSACMSTLTTFPGLSLPTYSLGSGTTYTHSIAFSPTCLYTSGNKLRATGCSGTESNGIISKSLRGTEELYMFYYFTADAGCRMANGGVEAADHQVREDLTTVSPNPAKNTVVVRGKSPLLQIAIYDVSGIRRLQVNGGNQWVRTIDISGLIPGMYLVEIRTKEGRESRKLIVQ